MKSDAYLKIILTVIAVCLTWICVRDFNLVSTASAKSAAKVEIKGYRLGWNQRTTLGVVQLQRADNNQLIDVPLRSAADVAGWATILSQKPVYMDDNGWIYTGSELTGP
jgi:hypothetical protein